MNTDDSRQGGDLQKLAEENRALRRQRVFTTLGAIGAFVSFCVTHTSEITVFFTKKPRISISSSDDFVRANGNFKVSLKSGETPSLVVSERFNEVPQTFVVSPGPYNFAATLQEEIVFEQEFTVQSGNNTHLVVPRLDEGTIRLVVKRPTKTLGRGAPVVVEVESSGNGYLWVFDKQRDHFVPIYPRNCAANCSNEIAVAESFRFPDKRGEVLYADVRPGPETLLFVLTSTAKLSDAQRLAQRFDQNYIPKARTGTREPNWGYKMVSYAIE